MGQITGIKSYVITIFLLQPDAPTFYEHAELINWYNIYIYNSLYYCLLSHLLLCQNEWLFAVLAGDFVPSMRSTHCENRGSLYEQRFGVELGHEWIITPNSLYMDVITYPCHRSNVGLGNHLLTLWRHQMETFFHYWPSVCGDTWGPFTNMG